MPTSGWRYDVYNKDSQGAIKYKIIKESISSFIRHLFLTYLFCARHKVWHWGHRFTMCWNKQGVSCELSVTKETRPSHSPCTFKLIHALLQNLHIPAAGWLGFISHQIKKCFYEQWCWIFNWLHQTWKDSAAILCFESQFFKMLCLVDLHMVDIKEVSKRAALLLGLLDCQAAFLRKPHERMPFFLLWVLPQRV